MARLRPYSQLLGSPVPIRSQQRSPGSRNARTASARSCRPTRQVSSIRELSQPTSSRLLDRGAAALRASSALEALKGQPGVGSHGEARCASSSSSSSSSAAAADILLVDATNVLFIAKGTPGKGGVAAKLEAWLTYLTGIVSPSTYAVAVFDSRPLDNSSNSKSDLPLRRRHHPGYKQKKRRCTSQGGVPSRHQVAPSEMSGNGSQGGGANDRSRSSSSIGSSPVKDSSSSASMGRTAPLGPSLSAAVRRAGAVAVMAPLGHEADDMIGALATRAGSAGLRTVIASRDSDMQALMLGGRTTWLELMDRPAPAKPAACAVHTAQEFEAEHGFGPESYAHFLALVGKPAAGVKSIGLGKKAAQKLVARYRTVDRIIEAGQNNELAGWGSRVQEAFGACGETRGRPSAYSPAEEAARRNLAVLSVQQIGEAEVRGAMKEAQITFDGLGSSRSGSCVDEGSVAPLPSAGVGSAERGGAGSWGGLPDVTWEAGALLYPPNAIHLRCCRSEIETMAKVLLRLGVESHSPFVTPSEWRIPGLLVDVYIPQGWNATDSLAGSNQLETTRTGGGNAADSHAQHGDEAPGIAVRLLSSEDMAASYSDDGKYRATADNSAVMTSKALAPATKMHIGMLKKCSSAWQVKLVVCEEWARLKSPKEQENFVTANILGLLNADTIEAILQ